MRARRSAPVMLITSFCPSAVANKYSVSLKHINLTFFSLSNYFVSCLPCGTTKATNLWAAPLLTVLLSTTLMVYLGLSSPGLCSWMLKSASSWFPEPGACFWDRNFQVTRAASWRETTCALISSGPIRITCCSDRLISTIWKVKTFVRWFHEKIEGWSYTWHSWHGFEFGANYEENGHRWSSGVQLEICGTRLGTETDSERPTKSFRRWNGKFVQQMLQNVRLQERDANVATTYS